MDDFNLSTLTESRNEYSALLVSKITPCLIQGISSIFNEACDLCVQNNEDEKYLMTFQNFLARVTKWNSEIIQRETERIMSESNCGYLDDLLTCVHVTQLKVLTNVRVGSKQKKVTIDIPKLDGFIHKCYIEIARKVYKNVFLFDRSVMPLTRQKNLRELELIVKECILNVIRDSMPIENILKSYLEEGIEETHDEEKTEVKEVEEPVPEEDKNEPVTQQIENDKNNNQENNNEDNKNEIIRDDKIQVDTETNNDSLKFNDSDEVKNYDRDENAGNVQALPVIKVEAPKDINRLEEISEMRNQQRKEEDDDSDYDEDDNSILKIHDDKDDIKLDVEKISTNSIKLNEGDLLGDIETLQ